jgi:putative membrane protein
MMTLRIQWTLIFALFFALITAVFAVANVNSVPVNFLISKTDIPLILVILGSTLLGGLIVGLFGIIRQYRLQKKISSLEKELTKLQTEMPNGISPEKSIEESLDESSQNPAEHTK